MPTQTETKPERVIQVGKDRVTVRDNEVTIEAKHEIPEWTVQTVNVPAIYFEDKKYLLLEKVASEPPYAFRYVLQPWPEGKVANPRQFHTYDAELVSERGSARRGETLNQVMWACLLPCYPFLGLLWSGMQHRLVRFGYLPRTITGISIFTNFCLTMTQGAFMALLLNASARSGKMMIGGMIRAIADQNYLHLGAVNIPVGIFDVLLGMALVADVLMRYSHYLREDQWTGGFLEWLVPKSVHRE